MKGWEIYSWVDTKCAVNAKSEPVCFTLMPGTNRRKTTEEIRKTPLALATLEVRIARLRQGDEVFWQAPDDTFDVPDDARGREDPRNKAVAALLARGLKLTVTRPR